MSVIGLVIHFIAVGPHRYSFSPPCERSSIIKEIPGHKSLKHTNRKMPHAITKTYLSSTGGEPPL